MTRTSVRPSPPAWRRARSARAAPGHCRTHRQRYSAADKVTIDVALSVRLGASESLPQDHVSSVVCQLAPHGPSGVIFLTRRVHVRRLFRNWLRLTDLCHQASRMNDGTGAAPWRGGRKMTPKASASSMDAAGFGRLVCVSRAHQTTSHHSWRTDHPGRRSNQLTGL